MHCGQLHGMQVFRCEVYETNIRTTLMVIVSCLCGHFYVAIHHYLKIANYEPVSSKFDDQTPDTTICPWEYGAIITGLHCFVDNSFTIGITSRVIAAPIRLTLAFLPASTVLADFVSSMAERAI